MSYLKMVYGGLPVWVWGLVFGVFPIANEIVSWGKWTKAQSVLQALARGVLKLLSVPFPQVSALADKVVPNLYQPPEPPPLPEVDVTPTKPVRMPMLLPLVPLLFALHGCYCWQPAHKDEAVCKAITTVVDCTKPDIAKSVEAVLIDVIQAIASMDVDWSALGKLEGQYGLDVIACAIQRADGALSTPSMLKKAPQVSPAVVHKRAISYYKSRKVVFK